MIFSVTKGEKGIVVYAETMIIESHFVEEKLTSDFGESFDRGT